MGLLIFFVLIMSSPIISLTSAALPGLPSLASGSSLAAERENEFLVSRNGIFSAGFYEVGTNAVCFAIWFNDYVNSSSTVVWMANRDVPVSSKKSRLILDRNGNLRLNDEYGSTVWSTDTFSNFGVKAHLLDTGNLVLLDQAKGEIIWQSFDFPTDTLLPSQRLTKNTTLVSTRGRGTYFSGFYNAKFGDNNVFYLIYNGPLVSSVYLPNSVDMVFESGRTPYNSTRMAVLDYSGQFLSSDGLIFNASDYGIGPKRRLKLDYDGILRLYSLDESTGLWEISWLPRDLDACLVHGLCGEFGLCVYRPNPTCLCPYGFVRNDHSDWSKGCSPSFNLSTEPKNIGFVEYPRTDYFGYDLETYSSNSTLEACKNSCLQDPRCLGFGYRLEGNGQCYPKGTLLNGNQMPSSIMTMYIKVPIEVARHGRQFMNKAVPKLNCSGSGVLLNTTEVRKVTTNKNGYLTFMIAFTAAVGGIEAICFAILWFFVFRKHDHEEIGRMGYAMLEIEFKRFSFAELKRATRNFREEIGRGGFGTVYKGVLDNERVVAVKRLEGLTQGDAEFWAEVSIIGKINHRNLVKLWGFCAEGEQKLLVYEFVSNGSLDKLLFQDSSAETLGFDKRFDIALGTAKGLSYLHEECLEWVLHCDVKPQNILLDDNFEPKVSDFGMSKLVKDIHDEGFSRVRGTRGYLAPDWLRNNKINAKVDVYSYGIVLLELLTGKSAPSLLTTTTHTIEQNHLVQGAAHSIKIGELKNNIDPRLSGYSEKKLENLVRTALLCVQEDPDSRPAMSKVVDLLCECDESSEDHSSN